MTNILGGYKELVRWSGCCVVLNGSNEAERGCDGGGEKSNQTHWTRTRGQKLIWCWFICSRKFVSFSSSTAAVQLSVFVFVCLVPFLVWWVDHKTKDSLSTQHNQMFWGKCIFWGSRDLCYLPPFHFVFLCLPTSWTRSGSANVHYNNYKSASVHRNLH